MGDGRLDHLGPDLCEPTVDIDECVARALGVDPELEVGDMLLDQRIAAGIGNIYKCETPFACGLSPFAAAGEVDAAARHSLYAMASRLLQQNLGRWRRETRGDGVAVYDRAGQGCRVCLDRIRVRTHGVHGRMTFWCPTCQSTS